MAEGWWNLCSQKKDDMNPKMKELHSIRGVLRNRLSYINGGFALGLLRKSVRLGAPIETLKEIARGAKDWTDWRTSMEAYIDQLEKVHRQHETPKAETKPVQSPEEPNESA